MTPNQSQIRTRTLALRVRAGGYGSFSQLSHESWLRSFVALGLEPVQKSFGEGLTL